MTSTPDDGLTGQVALITGASRGLGRLVALALAGHGMRVALLARDPNRLNTVATECAAAGAPATQVLAVDVTDRAAVQAGVAAVEQTLGPIDLLVNNAGLIDTVEVRPWEADPDSWWRVVEGNVRGPFLLLHAALPGMVARGRGRIVDVNTGMATLPAPRYSAYSVAKTALARLTDVLGHALDGTGVHAFDVAPGVVRTDMTAAMPMHAGRTEWTDPARFTGLIVAIAQGRLDPWSGRFLHARTDDVQTLQARARAGLDDDARTLRLRGYGPDDPLA